MKLSFTKMHGTGNDFVVIDATERRFAPTPALLRHLTDRHFGIGCDQVLVVEAPSSGDFDFDYRIFNPDGSEVGQCGNGARALARYIRERGLSDKPRLRVRTRTAQMELEQLPGGHARVNMGAPRFAPAQIPLSLSPPAARYRVETALGVVEFGVASMGNPHAVILVDDVQTADVEGIGRALQAHAAFPESVNVGFLQVIDREHGALRVYERGAGETLACGSGACAAMAVGREWGLFGDSVALKVLGGELRLDWAGGESPIYLSGPAEFVFTGEIEWPA